MKKTVLVVGGHGLVGSHIFSSLALATSRKPFRFDAYRTHHGRNFRRLSRTRHLNLAYETSFGLVLSEIKPEIVYLCGAMTNVDDVETNPQAFDTNLTGTLEFIKECQRRDSRIVFFSSSYVFDGTKDGAYDENDIPNPINNYGKYKLEAENQVLDVGDGLVIRTCGVFADEGKNFKSQVLKAHTIYAPTDQYLNPIHAKDLTRLSIEVEQTGYAGIVNIAGNLALSKYEWARGIRKANGLNEIDVVPLSGQFNQQKAPRPKNGTLSIRKLMGLVHAVPTVIPDFILDN